jgi:DNA-binding NarL/FixJ family response regulator
VQADLTRPQDVAPMTRTNAPSKGRASRILIADDEPNVRFALRVLLAQQPGLRVEGEAADAKALLERMEADCPEVVLLDWDLGGVTGDDLLPAMRQRCPRTAVIVLSGKPGIGAAALAAGADAFVSKADPPEGLLAAIRSARQE